MECPWVGKTFNATMLSNTTLHTLDALAAMALAINKSSLSARNKNQISVILHRNNSESFMWFQYSIHPSALQIFHEVAPLFHF